MASVVYRKLTRTRRTPAGSSQLWIAEDHLLAVNRNWFVESYQRFRLSDIHCIVVSQRPSWLGLQVTLLAVTLLIFSLIEWQAGSANTRIAWLFLWVPILAWQAGDLARGPYCRCTIQTAVSSVRLGAISRARVARQFLARIVPLIEAAQGSPEVPELPVPKESTGFIYAPDEIAPPILPARRMPLTPVVTYWVVTIAGGVIGWLSLMKILGNEAFSLSVMGSILQIFLGGFLVFRLSAEGWSILRLLLLLSACAAALDLGVSIIAILQTFGNLVSKGPKAGTDPLQYLPAWFELYARVSSSTMIFLGTAGLVFTGLSRSIQPRGTT